ncbi:Retrovirus-related Pol polyprotein from type-2 retrotransposable element R2DM [Araneus ventricosus]|uniref:Retrovirus-related Pol polyprotein from type-2 retrotransposable element R2DM n=1 Tax=Araneus ventricosus TaxID=182803 RepID=A0A4Y2J8B8_ARAVE|nr:Retrovirus-related Pol polyprotein from type-2 retrotransposable element R2DM [Araneus ventricosus]
MSLPRDFGSEAIFSSDLTQPTDGHTNLLSPITLEELNKYFPRNNSASGSDLSTVSDLKQVSRFELLKIFNIFLFCRKVPARFCKSRAVFIPKKSPGAAAPGDFRPISLTPIPARLFSKITTRRLSPAARSEPEQRSFIESDGISQNIFILDHVLRHASEKIQRTCIASIDLRKVFDSVSHQAVFAALKDQSIDPEFVKIIEFMYNNSSTSFAPFRDHDFSSICGVKKGDPLSSILFNLVIDEFVRNLRGRVGLSIDGLTMSISSYADDILLFASSLPGLQHLLDETTNFLSKCNLHINYSKSFTIAIFTDSKNKKTKIYNCLSFKVSNSPIISLKVNESFKYLGVSFSAKGLLAADCSSTLNNYLFKLKSAPPLKSQQRLWILKNTFLPMLFHLLVLSSVPAGKLAKLDSTSRAFVRGILYLPGYCPNAYLHASVADGGLGVPSIRVLVPLWRLSRLVSLGAVISGEGVSGGIDQGIFAAAGGSSEAHPAYREPQSAFFQRTLSVNRWQSIV